MSERTTSEQAHGWRSSLLPWRVNAFIALVNFAAAILCWLEGHRALAVFDLLVAVGYAVLTRMSASSAR